jgi:predicted negative regulator of RcsB-dependent stress response
VVSNDKKVRKVKAALLIYVAWNLWKERNRRIFQSYSMQPSQIMQEIKSEVWMRTVACGSPALPFIHV